MLVRTRYQYGSLRLRKRERGPDVWEFRYYETDSQGKRKRQSVILGDRAVLATEKRLFPDETIKRFDAKGKLPACQGSLGAQTARVQTIQILGDQVFRPVNDAQVLRPAAFHCGLSVSPDHRETSMPEPETLQALYQVAEAIPRDRA